MHKKLPLFLILLAILVVTAACAKNNDKNLVDNELPITKTPVEQKIEITKVASTTEEEKIEIDEPVLRAEEQKIEINKANPEISRRPSVLSLKVGDKIKSFTVTKIEALNPKKPFYANNFSISFDGQATVTGNYDLSDLHGKHFLTPDGTDVLPRLLEKETYNLYFPKDDDKFEGRQGRAKITFDGLILESNSTESYFDGSQKIINLEILK